MSTPGQKPIGEIREAFLLVHRVATGVSERSYMSIPADPERDADLIVMAAIDELEQARARVETLLKERAEDVAVRREVIADRDRAEFGLGHVTVERDVALAEVEVLRVQWAAMKAARDRIISDLDAARAEREQARARIVELEEGLDVAADALLSACVAVSQADNALRLSQHERAAVREAMTRAEGSKFARTGGEAGAFNSGVDHVVDIMRNALKAGTT
jgi:hypothetical protein